MPAVFSAFLRNLARARLLMRRGDSHGMGVQHPLWLLHLQESKSPTMNFVSWIRNRLCTLLRCMQEGPETRCTCMNWCVEFVGLCVMELPQKIDWPTTND